MPDTSWVSRLLHGRFRARQSDPPKLKDSATIERLADALHHPDPAVRQDAASALGKVNDPQAVAALLPALSDEQWEVRQAAVRALGARYNQSDEPCPTLDGQPKKDTAPAATSPVRRSPAGSDTQTNLEPVQDALITALHDGAWQVRAAAAETLAGHKFLTGEEGFRARSAEALLSALSDERSAVRDASARGLARMGAPTVEPLLLALSSETGHVREAAATAMAALGPDLEDDSLRAAVLQPLIAALVDTDARVRLAATRALGQVGARLEDRDQRGRAIRALAKALQEADGQGREAAARALGQIGDARAVEPLIAATQDPRNSVQKAADQALDRLARAQGIHTGPVRV